MKFGGTSVANISRIKNIVELDKKEAELWSMGNDLDKKLKVYGFVILKHKKDFIGCGKYKEGKIFNYVPK